MTPVAPQVALFTSPSRRGKGLPILAAWARGGVGDGDLGEGLLVLVRHRFGDLHRDRIRSRYLHIADLPTRVAHGRDLVGCAILR